MDNLLGIILGALLAFISLYIIENIKNWNEKKRKQKNFRLFVKLELQVILKTLDKIQTGLDYGHYYDFSLLDRTKESIDSLEKARSDIIYLTDPELKEKFIDLISDVSTFIIMVRLIQQQFYGEQKPVENRQNKKTQKTKREENIKKELDEKWKLFNERKTEKTIEYIEIKRKLEDLIKEISD